MQNWGPSRHNVGQRVLWRGAWKNSAPRKVLWGGWCTWVVRLDSHDVHGSAARRLECQPRSTRERCMLQFQKSPLEYPSQPINIFFRRSLSPVWRSAGCVMFCGSVSVSQIETWPSQHMSTHSLRQSNCVSEVGFNVSDFDNNKVAHAVV